MVNYTLPTNVSSLADLMQYTDTVVSQNVAGTHWFGTIILVLVFLIAFLAFKTSYPTEQALVPTMFLVSILSILLYIIGILNILWVVLAILGLAASAIMLFLSGT